VDARAYYKRRLPWVGRVPTQGRPAGLILRPVVVRPPTPAYAYAGRVIGPRVPLFGTPNQLRPRVTVVRPATPAVYYQGRAVLQRVPGTGKQAPILRPVLVAGRRPGPPPGLAFFTRPPRANPPASPTRVVRGVYVVAHHRPAFAARSVVWSSRVGLKPPLPDHAWYLPASVRTAFILAASARTAFRLAASVRTGFRLEAHE
jgi:hypothetical protein